MKNALLRTLSLWAASGGLLLLVGCSRSIEVNYPSPSTSLGSTTTAAAPRNLSIGVTRLEDRRSIVDPSDPQSEGYVGVQQSWKFGMTFRGRDYFPIKDLVQTVLLEELQKAGFQGRPIDRAVSRQNVEDVKAAGKQAGADYVIVGEVLAFEWINDVGFWTVDSRRTVTVSLSVIRVADGQNMFEKVFTETQRENEGMGVLHSTNNQKLMEVFSRVTDQVVREVAAKAGPVVKVASSAVVSGAATAAAK